jgi:hypothetical protein
MISQHALAPRFDLPANANTFPPMVSFDGSPVAVPGSPQRDRPVKMTTSTREGLSLSFVGDVVVFESRDAGHEVYRWNGATYAFAFAA